MIRILTNIYIYSVWKALIGIEDKMKIVSTYRFVFDANNNSKIEEIVKLI